MPCTNDVPTFTAADSQNCDINNQLEDFESFADQSLQVQINN